jgi:hypothetical protein
MQSDHPKEVQLAPGVYMTDYRSSSSPQSTEGSSQEVFTEIQLKPGIYMIDYRHPTHLSPDRLSSHVSSGPLTADQYIQELQRMNLMSEDFLRSEYERIQLSISKLEESNLILAQDPDPEMQEALVENQQIIATSQEKLRRLQEFLPGFSDQNQRHEDGIYL